MARPHQDLETGVAQSVIDSCVREGNTHEWPDQLAPQNRYHTEDFPAGLNRQNTQMGKVSTAILHRANRLLLRAAWFRWQEENNTIIMYPLVGILILKVKTIWKSPNP